MRPTLTVCVVAVIALTAGGLGTAASAAPSNGPLSSGDVANGLPSGEYVANGPQSNEYTADAYAGDRHPKAPARAAASSDAADAVPKSLEGDVTTAPIFHDGRLLVGTERGVYAFADGDLETFVESRPVEGIAPIEGDRVVVLVDDEHFPNVLAVDVATGETVWRESRHREIYNRDVGYVERQVPAFAAEPIGDVSGDGSTDVAVAVGTAVVAVDGASGDRLWTVERPYNVWELEATGTGVYAGTQGGSLVAIDAATGERRYERELAEPVADSSLGEIPRAVWDVETVVVDARDRLVVATEDGVVSLVDPTDGGVVWAESLVEFDHDRLVDYYQSGRERREQPSLPGDSNYRNLELHLDDGLADGGILASAHVEEHPPHRNYEHDHEAIYRLSAADGTVEWSDETVDLDDAGTLVYSEEIRGGSLLIPGTQVDDSQSITAFDAVDGTEGEALELASVGGAGHTPRDIAGYLAVDGGRIAATDTTGDLLIADETGAVEWRVPALRGVEATAVDALGDGRDDYLLESTVDRRGRQQARSLGVRSGTDGSVAWLHVLDTETFLEDGGYDFVRPYPAAGGADVLAVHQPARPWEREEPTAAVVRFDGASGTELGRWEAPDGEIRSIAVVDDLTGDGRRDVLVHGWAGSRVLELSTGTAYSYRGGSPMADDVRYLTVGGPDGAQRVLAVGGDGEVALLEPAVSGGELSFATIDEWTIDTDGGVRRVERLADRTGDGYDEVVVELHEEVLALVAPGAGTVVGSWEPAHRTVVSPIDGDLTGDGTRGHLVVDRANPIEVSVYEGSTRVWYEEYDRIPNVEEVTNLMGSAGDVTGDGVDELAVVESSFERGAQLHIYDVTAEQRVNTIILSHWEAHDNRDPGPGLSVQGIPDRTGDERPELGVVAPRNADPEKGVHYYVVDPTAGEVLISGEGRLSAFLALEDGVGTLGADGSLRTTDVTAGVTITDTDVDGSTVDVAWSVEDGGEHVATVTVDGRPAAVAADGSATIEFPEGDHEIGVRATGPDGVTVHDTAAVSVSEGSSMDLVLYLATGLSVGALFAIGLLPGVRRRVIG